MRITFIGSGNVATRLGKAFQKAGHKIVLIISRNESTGEQLADTLKCGYSDKYDVKRIATDIFIVAVKDSEIEKVAQKLKTKSIVAHTSGSISTAVFKKRFKNYGAFYPLQTIKFNREINFKPVPVCLEANNTGTEQALFQLAQSVSENIYFLSSEQRLRAHLAAVFANNFTNHLYRLAENILNENDLSFDLIKPLIKQTAKNIQFLSPSETQTGPAIRRDKITIDNHLKLLKGNDELIEMYKLFTGSILKTSTQ